MTRRREVVPGIAEAITDRRHTLGLTLGDLIEATGLTRQGLAPLLRGERRAYQERLTLAVCRTLGWTPDSIGRLLRGEPPELLPATQPGALSELQALCERVARLEADVRELVETATDLVRRRRAVAPPPPLIRRAKRA